MHLCCVIVILSCFHDLRCGASHVILKVFGSKTLVTTQGPLTIRRLHIKCSLDIKLIKDSLTICYFLAQFVQPDECADSEDDAVHPLKYCSSCSHSPNAGIQIARASLRMDEFEWVKSFATSSYGTVSDVVSSVPNESLSAPKTTSRGSFASFVCHVVRLERKLRSFSSLVLDDSSNVKVTNKILGQGKTFMVRYAQWVRNPKEPPLDVALKEIVSDVQAPDGASR